MLNPFSNIIYFASMFCVIYNRSVAGRSFVFIILVNICIPDESSVVIVTSRGTGGC